MTQSTRVKSRQSTPHTFFLVPLTALYDVYTVLYDVCTALYDVCTAFLNVYSFLQCLQALDDFCTAFYNVCRSDIAQTPRLFADRTYSVVHFSSKAADYKV